MAVERTFPKIKAGYLIVRNEYAGVCLEGTRVWAKHDFEKFHGGGQSDYPDGLGHESVGVVAALHRNCTVIALIRNKYREDVLRKMGVGHFINPNDEDWQEKVRALTYNGQGSEVSKLKPGDRVAINGFTPCGECVACRNGIPNACVNNMIRTIGQTPVLDGAFADYIWLPDVDITAVEMPDDLSSEEGAFTEPAATVVHAIRISPMKAGDTVAVVGAGPIGLLCAAALQAAGAGNSIALSGQAQAVTAGAKKYMKDLQSRGVDVVPVPFDDVYHFTGSGMHCATFSYWREDD